MDGPDTLDDAIRSRADLIESFSAGEAIAKQFPIRTLRLDFRGGESFVIAIIPFDEVGVDFGCLTEAGKLARAPRPKQRTGKHFAELLIFEPLAELAGIALTAWGERQVRQPCVLAAQCPGGFAVPR